MSQARLSVDRCRNRRGYTLVELSVALSLATILSVAMGSVIFISTKGLDKTSATIEQSETERILAEMNADLRMATALLGVRTDGFIAVVPDRDNDGKDEYIHYRWQGSAGSPGALTRKVNTGDAVTILDDVHDARFQSMMRTVLPQAALEADPTVHDSAFGFFEAEVDEEQWIAVGTYAGDGKNGREIAIAGFATGFVLVKGENNHSYLQARSTAMPDTKELGSGGGLQGHRIKSFAAEGFEVGKNNAINEPGEVFSYVAFTPVAGLWATGTYEGNRVDNRAINVGFQPGYVILIPELADSTWHRPSSVSGDLSLGFFGQNARSGRIKSLTSTGFTVGDHNDVNGNTRFYHWVAFKESPGQVVCGSYTGDGSATRAINGVGFQPRFVLVANEDGGISAVCRSTDNSGDHSMPFAAVPLVTERIRSLDADGFTVGQQEEVNDTGRQYYFVAFR